MLPRTAHLPHSSTIPRSLTYLTGLCVFAVASACGGSDGDTEANGASAGSSGSAGLAGDTGSAVSTGGRSGQAGSGGSADSDPGTGGSTATGGRGEPSGGSGIAGDNGSPGGEGGAVEEGGSSGRGANEDAGGEGGSQADAGGATAAGGFTSSAGSTVVGGALATGGSTATGGSNTTGGASAAGGEAGDGRGGAVLAGGGGEAGSGQAGAGDGGADSNVPLLERTPRLEQDCVVQHPLTKLDINPWLSGSLASTPAGVYLLRGQGADQSVDQMVVSTVDVNGSLGQPIAVSPEGGQFYDWPQLTPRDGGLAASWSTYENDGTRNLMLALLDESGAVTQPAAAITPSPGQYAGLAITAATDGYALIYQETAEDYSSTSILFATLDDAGALVGSPRPISESASNLSPGQIVALPDGYAVTYATMDYTVENGGHQYLAFLTSDGALDGDPVELGTASDRADAYVSLLLRGSELIVAYSQRSGDMDATAAALHLARVDLATHDVIADVEVQAPVLDEENVSPQLLAVGEEIALLWSRGSVIYICAGCMPDNHLEFVLVDGDDFTPISQLVVLENQEPMGGFVWPRIAASGAELLIASTLEYHVSGEGAFASVQCQAR